jgi:hypothetical protein
MSDYMRFSKDIDSLFREFKEYDRMGVDKDLLDYVNEYDLPEDEFEKPKKRGQSKKKK